MDYAALRPVTFPEMIMEPLETPSTTNPMGINGVGELLTVAAPAAMTNAVLDALAHRGGAPINIPMTAEKVWRAITRPINARTRLLPGFVFGNPG